MRSLASFIAVLLFLFPAWVSASEHCPADFDGDGDVDAADLAELLASWGPCPLCGNGVVDPGEQCDPPNGLSCDDSCQLQPTDCCSPHVTAGCEDPICEASVCEVDSFCCDSFWDGQCALEAAELCPECLGLDCCFEHFSPGCTDPDCESAVCGIEPLCCGDGLGFVWDQTCTDLAADNCSQCFP